MLRAFIRLIRWPNLLIIGLLLVLAKTQIIEPISLLAGFPTYLTSLHWWLLVGATILIAASGNVVNDIFDQDVDSHNRPKKQIVGNLIAEQTAWNIYYALVTIGVGLGIYLCLILGNVSSALIFVLTTGGLYFYSYSYKRQFLIGNLVVAMLAGMVPLLPIYFQSMQTSTNWIDFPWSPILLAYAFFALITTLLREVIKDMEDVEGDSRYGCKTVPIVIGLQGAKMVVLLLVLGLIGAIVWLQSAWIQQDDLVSVFYFALGVQLPALAVAYLTIKGHKPSEFRMASTLTKGLMFTGILSMFIFGWTVE